MIAAIIAILLGISMLGFVLNPLYRDYKSKQAASKEPANSETLERESAEQARDARTALQEIELDYQLGNISEEDYRSLRERYVRRALVALKSRYEREQELDEMIEEQLRSMREGHEKTDT